MAEALTADQRASLVMFGEVTANARDESSSIRLLQSCGWNLEQALQLHWTAGDDIPAQASNARSAGRPENTEQLIPDGETPGGELGLVGNIFHLIWSLIRWILKAIFGFLAFDNIMEEQSGSAIQRQLSNRYRGVTQPVFFEGSFSQALEKARKDVKLLVVYLHSEHSRFTGRFCSEVLPNDFIRLMLDENFLLWGGDIARIEAHQVAQMVQARQFPCFCVLLPASIEEIRVIGALNGDVGVEDTSNLLARCLEEMEVHSTEIIARQEQRHEDRLLRSSQDQEFEEALQMDRIREEKQRAEMAERAEAERKVEEARRAEEEERQRLLAELQRIEDNRQAKASTVLPPGPDATSNLCIRLPAGQRIQRKFRPDTTLQDVYSWAECIAYLPESLGKGLQIPRRFLLSTSFPKRDLTEMSATVQEMQLAGAVVLLTEIDDDN